MVATRPARGGCPRRDSVWELGGDAEAGASGAVSNIDVYKITKTGVVLAATVGGTKYWVDETDAC